jgi:hypothetical protein
MKTTDRLSFKKNLQLFATILCLFGLAKVLTLPFSFCGIIEKRWEGSKGKRRDTWQRNVKICERCGAPHEQGNS